MVRMHCPDGQGDRILAEATFGAAQTAFRLTHGFSEAAHCRFTSVLPVCEVRAPDLHVPTGLAGGEHSLRCHSASVAVSTSADEVACKLRTLFRKAWKIMTDPMKCTWTGYVVMLCGVVPASRHVLTPKRLFH